MSGKIWVAADSQRRRNNVKYIELVLHGMPFHCNGKAFHIKLARCILHITRDFLPRETYGMTRETLDYLVKHMVSEDGFHVSRGQKPN